MEQDKVTYSWRIDIYERVQTPHDDEGFVTMLGIDESRSPKCYVETSKRDTTRWYEEFRLKKLKVGGKE